MQMTRPGTSRLPALEAEPLSAVHTRIPGPWRNPWVITEVDSARLGFGQPLPERSATNGEQGSLNRFQD